MPDGEPRDPGQLARFPISETVRSMMSLTDSNCDNQPNFLTVLPLFVSKNHEVLQKIENVTRLQPRHRAPGPECVIRLIRFGLVPPAFIRKRKAGGTSRMPTSRMTHSRFRCGASSAQAVPRSRFPAALRRLRNQEGQDRQEGRPLPAVRGRQRHRRPHGVSNRQAGGRSGPHRADLAHARVRQVADDGLRRATSFGATQP